MNFNDKYRERTKLLALQVIKLIQGCKKDFVNEVLLKQLLRSSTSVAANFRATCRSRSDNERYAKLSITVEELDETLFWLELLTDAQLIPDEKTVTLKQEALEILKVFSTYRKKMNER